MLACFCLLVCFLGGGINFFKSCLYPLSVNIIRLIIWLYYCLFNYWCFSTLWKYWPYLFKNVCYYMIKFLFYLVDYIWIWLEWETLYCKLEYFNCFLILQATTNNVPRHYGKIEVKKNHVYTLFNCVWVIQNISLCMALGQIWNQD